MLKSLGYVRGENVFFPGPPGTLSFFWSEPKDFLSAAGIDASVLPLDAEGKQAWNTSNDWAVRTRTSISASTYDQEFQNHTVRRIRRAFGGTFYNDHFGHNRYIQVPPDDSTPASRGISGSLSRVLQDLRALEHVVPAEMFKSLNTPQGVITDDNDKTGILKITRQMDPSRVLYNALVPFLVAAIEHAFRGTFEILLKYDAKAQRALDDMGRKVSYSDASAVARGDLTIERIASDFFSFQNLDSVQKAYKEVLSIDIWAAVRRRRRVRKKMPLLSEALKDLIGTRHGIVHQFSLNRDLDREGFLHLIALVRILVDVLAVEVSKKIGVAIQAES